MFERILVPLDGSSLAACAIPVAARLARAGGGSVVLTYITGTLAGGKLSFYEPYPVQSGAFAQEMDDREQGKARSYLYALARSPQLSGVRTETNLLPGATAQMLLEMAQAEHIDLIVMGNHGRAGFKRWLVGSMAPQVARLSPLPVLLLRESGPAVVDMDSPIRVLVALDGSRYAEAALMPAAQLARALNPTRGALHLVQIVTLPPGHNQQDDRAGEQTVSEAAHYLKSRAEQVQKDFAGDPVLHISWSVVTVAREDVADALLKVAEHREEETTSQGHSYDLIALATHGRGGAQHWTPGSIPERVLDHTYLPLLTVRPQACPAMARSELSGAPGAFTRSGQEVMVLEKRP